MSTLAVLWEKALMCKVGLGVFAPEIKPVLILKKKKKKKKSEKKRKKKK